MLRDAFGTDWLFALVGSFSGLFGAFEIRVGLPGCDVLRICLLAFGCVEDTRARRECLLVRCLPLRISASCGFASLIFLLRGTETLFAFARLRFSFPFGRLLFASGAIPLRSWDHFHLSRDHDIAGDIADLSENVTDTAEPAGMILGRSPRMRALVRDLSKFHALGIGRSGLGNHLRTASGSAEIFA